MSSKTTKCFIRFLGLPTAGILGIIICCLMFFGKLTSINTAIAWNGPCYDIGICGGLGCCCCTLHESGGYCVGTCVSGCPRGGTDWGCIGTSGDCHGYMGTCSTIYRCTCGFGGETLCQCNPGASFGSCSKSDCS